MKQETPTEKIIYIPKDAFSLVNEFRDLYTSLKYQIDQFIKTQPTFLNELRKKIKTQIGFLSPRQKDIALAIYGIIITEDIVKKYDPQNYADDVSALLEATNKKTTCTDDEFIGLITSFINSLKSTSEVVRLIINNFIEFKGRDLEDDIIGVLLIRRHFYPAISEAILRFEAAEFPIDIRWITAMFAHFIELQLIENNQIDYYKSIASLYENIISKYPLSKGEDLIFDLSYTFLTKLYYEQMLLAYKSRIDLLKFSLQDHQIKAKQEFPSSQKHRIQGSSEQILSAIEKVVFETFKRNREINEEKRQKLEKNIEVILKRMAIQEFGMQDIADEKRYMEYLLETWFVVFEEYPQMIIPLIDIKQYSQFIKEPKEYTIQNKERIIRQLQFKIRRHTGGGRLTTKILAKAFSLLLFEILNNNSVRSLSI